MLAAGLASRLVFGNIRFIYKSYISEGFVGIVKISEQMHENLRLHSAALSRSINAQAEHWLRVGMLSELNPGLRYDDICRLLIEAEQSRGAVDVPRLVEICA
jgi:hypothetical protein